MARRSARATAICLLCAIDIACGSLGEFVTSPGKSVNCDTSNDPQCDWLSFVPRDDQYLLLGDTIAFFTRTSGGKTDNIKWAHSGNAVSFLGPADIHTVAYVTYAHQIVRGEAVGAAIVTATRKVYSVNANVGVVQPADLQQLAIRRAHCTGIAAVYCTSGPFNDTLKVGDTATVIGRLTDIAGHTVNATLLWSTSDSSTAVTALSRSAEGSAQVVVGKAVGDATITAKVAGLNNSFALHIVK